MVISASSAVIFIVISHVFRVEALMSRAPRPLTSHFAVSDLVDGWIHLAALKHPGFAWDGTDYMVSKRSLTGDTVALAARKSALKPLVQLAPTGFPSHPVLKETFAVLHRKCNIFGSGVVNTPVVCSEAADRWRIMMRHLYNNKRMDVQDPALADLLEGIKLPSETSAAGPPKKTIHLKDNKKQ